MGPIGRTLTHDADQLSAFDHSIETLRKLGAEMVELDMDLDAFISNPISGSEGYFNHKQIVEDPNSKMDEGVRSRLLQGKELCIKPGSAQDYIRFNLACKKWHKEWLEDMKSYRAWLSPTFPGLPIPLSDLKGVDENTNSLAVFTRFVNLLGLCAVSLPSSLTTSKEIASAGLPTSLQIACRPNDEITALRIARAFEIARGPFPKPPLAFANTEKA